MMSFLATSSTLVADASAPAHFMSAYVAPIIEKMCVLATITATFFLASAGIKYMSSSGDPEKHAHAKDVMKKAITGLLLVLAAATLTAILAHAYHQPAVSTANNLPSLNDIKPDTSGGGLVGVLLHAITGVLNDIIQTAAAPFLKALNYFTTSTPLIADNSSVFNLWLAILGIADAIFVVVIGMLGFQLMSASTFGFDEIEFRHLLPRIGLIFLLMNSSVVIIDGLIAFSNALIHALESGFTGTSIWDSLTVVVKQSGGLGLAALLIMIAFLILAVILLVYYVGRIVTLYIGAVLSPLVFMIWLIPGFRDFSETAIKTYLTTIFVLFIHVVILLLAASLFVGMAASSPSHTLDPLMSMVVGLATLVALVKTQGVMLQFSYVSMGTRSARKLGGQFINGVSSLNAVRRGATTAVTNTTTKHIGSSRTSSGFNQPKPRSTGGHTMVPASSLQPQPTAVKPAQKPRTGTTTVAPPIEQPKPTSPIEGDKS